MIIFVSFESTRLFSGFIPVVLIFIGLLLPLDRRDIEVKTKSHFVETLNSSAFNMFGLAFISFTIFFIFGVAPTDPFDERIAASVMFIFLGLSLISLGLATKRYKFEVNGYEFSYTPVVGRKEIYSFHDIEKITTEGTILIFIKGKKRPFSFESNEIGDYFVHKFLGGSDPDHLRMERWHDK
jgi:hypothetical protein